mmetsp:Transcript_34022/g.104083  ORF Transcript_34022/g.104083 Transcript_34022/m.104083 type:complete len:228 (+) Transcript_34022:1439-2122(+)
MCTPWWAWYFSLMPRRMVSDSAGVGSATITGWKRRASAASFSIARYSLSVVAPTTAISPRASCGLRSAEASIAPSASPAPITEWISSMKRITSPSESAASLSTPLKRSSNSPRNFAPASSVPISTAISRRERIESGTSRSTMRWASPSATAVFPTPGSPISTGLFFRRRESTWIVLRISSSRPTTVSSLPSRAIAVRSLPYLCSASPLSPPPPGTRLSGLTHALDED